MVAWNVKGYHAKGKLDGGNFHAMNKFPCEIDSAAH